MCNSHHIQYDQNYSCNPVMKRQPCHSLYVYKNIRLHYITEVKSHSSSMKVLKKINQATIISMNLALYTVFYE